jgi:hypothetical protein
MAIGPPDALWDTLFPRRVPDDPFHDHHHSAA